MRVFYKILKDKIKEYAHLVYLITRSFPKEELYGLTNQIKRATLSVLLNYIEGYARFRIKVNVNFLEIAYGSLKESVVALEFADEESFITKEEEYKKAIQLADEIGAMLWKTIQNKK